MIKRKLTYKVQVGELAVGGDEPIRIQSMTNTDTANVQATTSQILELVQAGSEMVRVTVNTPEAAQAIHSIKGELEKQGCRVPLIGDFHYNGHLLLTQFPDCAKALDKYRINPGNVGRGDKKDEQFSTICRIAKENGKPIRIGVNGGSLDPELVEAKMNENTEQGWGKSSQEILNECMVISALQSTCLALSSGLSENQIIISCKVSRPQDLVSVYASLSSQIPLPLHVGLTEAGMGSKGIVSSSIAIGILLQQGIGDTIRVSLTPEPGGDRAQEVRVAQEILQSLGIRSFSPAVTACPGCGRTTSTVFQELTHEVQGHIRDKMPEWRERYEGVEKMTLAVMGCIVNGPGESKHADIGISLPGTGENPSAPVYVEGKQQTILKGDKKKLAREFISLVEKYIEKKYTKKIF